MATYRKKVIVEAEQFHPQQHLWPEGVKPWPDERGVQPRDMSWGYIDTLEGRMSVQAGAYIVTGIDGERYAVEGSIFERTYERVEGA